VVVDDRFVLRGAEVVERAVQPASTPCLRRAEPDVDSGALVARAFVQDAALRTTRSEKKKTLDRLRPFMYGREFGDTRESKRRGPRLRSCDATGPQRRSTKRHCYPKRGPVWFVA
jgi:hypothetical protein